MATIEREADGSTTESFEVSVAGDHVERLMREVFTDHWAHVSVGPIIESSACSTATSRSTPAPGTSTSASTTTAAPPTPSSPASAASPAPPSSAPRAARVPRDRGACASGTVAASKWSRSSCPTPTHFDDAFQRLREPRWEKTALWEDLRRRYAD